MGRAYDYWSLLDKEHYYPDGTMKTSYRQSLLDRGYDFFYTVQLEWEQKKKVTSFKNMEKQFEEAGWGSYSEFLDRSTSQEDPSQQKRRQQQALAEGAELSELPYDMAPDDYYDYHAHYPG